MFTEGIGLPNQGGFFVVSKELYMTDKWQPTPKEAVEAASQEKPLIGREDYVINDRYGAKARKFHIMSAKRLGDKTITDRLASRFHNNSSMIGPQFLGDARPASAYFTALDDNVIVEWGEIDPTGDAKLHTYLNRNIDFNKRRKEGGTIRSGHIGIVTFPGSEDSVRVALLDSIHPTQEITPDSAEYPIVVTLLNNKIYPVSAEGNQIKIVPPIESPKKDQEISKIAQGREVTVFQHLPVA